jgi:hypothetical protein
MDVDQVTYRRLLSAVRMSAKGRIPPGRYRQSGVESGRKMAVARVCHMLHDSGMNEHERGLLEFLIEPGRGRLGTLLELGSKRRRDVVSLLHNAVRLDPRFSTRLEGKDATAYHVEPMLLSRGAPPSCYVMSADDFDGREMPLSEALDAVFGWGNGAFISCIPGRLGYYEYAGIKSSYLLAR